jgi:ABC-type transport system involved in multi-copper enzyme maturation permease subunit
MNPVVSRELTERMRGLRAFVALAVFVLLLTITAFLVHEGVQASSSVFDLSARTRVGRQVFEAVVLIMAVLVLFFVPGLTAGAIAGERERQTLAPLQVTLLRPGSILVGKMMAAMAYLLLMLVAALPVLTAAYLLGGIRIVDVAKALAAVVLMAVLLATIVVAVSAFAKRVQTATVLAYGVTALLVLGGPIAFLTASVLDDRSAGDQTAAPAFLLTPNPIVLVADLGSGNVTSGAGPLSAIREGLAEAKQQNDGRWFALFPEDEAVGRGGFEFEERAEFDGGLPAWALATISLGTIAVVLFLAAARRLRTPAEVER